MEFIYMNYVNPNSQMYSIFNGWDADIILTDLKIAILWNGKWHYEKLTKKTFSRTGTE